MTPGIGTVFVARSDWHKTSSENNDRQKLQKQPCCGATSFAMGPQNPDSDL
jgi:hypothetical protein